MPQLNIHVPNTSDLDERVRRCAELLGTSPGSLARAVLEVALEPYVSAQLSARQQAERVYSAELVEALRDRASGPIPARRVPDEGDVAREAETAPEAAPRPAQPAAAPA